MVACLNLHLKNPKTSLQRLSPLERSQDPTLIGVARFTDLMGGSAARAAAMAGWSAEAVGADDAEGERLRLAATMLGLAAARLEPNIRVRHAVDWALHKRWIGMGMSGRARVAAALTGASGRTALAAELLPLAEQGQLYQAIGWGLAMRLCRRIGAGSMMSLTGSVLRREGERLVLRFDKTVAALCNESVESDLATLAAWLGLEHAIELPA